MADKEFRFRSMNGRIYSNDPDAFQPRLTTTRERCLLNEFYEELCKHDKAAADRICKKNNV